MRTLLLPGMDGTGELFAGVVRALAPELSPTVCAYPRDRPLGYDALERTVRGLDWSGAPTVVVAESFSGHLAMRLAAAPPPGLVGVVLVATFATPPAPTAFAPFVRPVLFGRPPPAFAARALLVGADAPSPLVDHVRATIATVRPAVLAHRLRAVLAEDSRAALRRASVPIALIRPTRDRLVRSFAPILSAAPGTAVFDVEAPHLVLQRAPGASAEVIKRAIARFA